MHAKILIIDDDKKIRELLKTYLESEGDFDCTTAEDALVAEEILKNKTFDLVITDVMMPKKNGVEFVIDFKKLYTTPVIMLTAMGDTSHRITGLESGADDYLPKPFEPRELLLRARNLIKLSKVNFAGNKNENDEFLFGDFSFNKKTRMLTKSVSGQEEKISLSSTESELLLELVENANEKVSRHELSVKFNGISERSIDVQVTRLRKKIELDATNPVFIQTVWGVGYVFRV